MNVKMKKMLLREETTNTITGNAQGCQTLTEHFKPYGLSKPRKVRTPWDSGR